MNLFFISLVLIISINGEQIKNEHSVNQHQKRSFKNLTTKRLNCNLSDCYPPTNDLLLGRSNFIYASSTCGLMMPEYFYILGHRTKVNKNETKFKCDSRLETYTNNHRIENVIHNFRADVDTFSTKWWQSQNGKDNVYIQFDLEAKFTLTHITMRFKSFPPAAMLIEKSTDFGLKWQTLAYYAANCGSSFPGISTLNKRDFDKPFCTSKYSGLEVSPSADLLYTPLLQLSNKSIDRTSLQNILKFTNLRFNFTKLHVLDDKLRNYYYYAINEIKVFGTCLCNGHSNECVKEPYIQYDEKHLNNMVHNICKCNHNTYGNNCELCLPLYNNKPWKPATNDNINDCQKCECNGHAVRCTFDAELFKLTNNRIGGRCHCLHNTDGLRCERCKTDYYRDFKLAFEHPNSCKRCKCNLLGTQRLNATDFTTICDSDICICKNNVFGSNCDTCKNGYWNLSVKNKEDGCKSIFLYVLFLIVG